MSTDYRFVAVTPANEKWKTMKAVWDACMEAKVHVPDAVLDFFDDQTPDEAGVIVNIEHQEGANDEGCFWEVDLSTIPKDATKIRMIRY